MEQKTVDTKYNSSHKIQESTISKSRKLDNVCYEIRGEKYAVGPANG